MQKNAVLMVHRLFPVFFSMAVLAACGDDDDPTPNPDPGSGGDSGGDTDEIAFTSPMTVTVEENSDAVIATIAASAMGSPTTLELSGGADRDAFSFDPASGELRFTSPPTFEAPPDADTDNAYQLELTARSGDEEIAGDFTAQVSDVVRPALLPRFPTPNSDLGGIERVTVSVRLVDVEEVPEGVPFDVPTDAQVSIAGTAADRDPSAPERWSLERSAVGLREIEADVEVDGEPLSLSYPIENVTLLASPRDVHVDLDGQRLWMADGVVDRLFEVDLTTGERTVLVSLQNFAQDLAFDPVSNRLILTSCPFGTSTSLSFVDPSDGELERLDLTTRPGPDHLCIEAMAPGDANSPTYIVAEVEQEGEEDVMVLELDLTTGARTIVSSSTVGTGDPLLVAIDLTIDRDGERAFILTARAQVVAVDLTDGNRTVVYDSQSEAEPLDRPVALVWDPQGERVLVAEPFEGIAAIDPTAGRRTRLSGGTFARDFFQISNMTLIDDRLFLAERLPGITEIDLETGGRSVVYSASIGDGPMVQEPVGLLLDPRATEGVIADPVRGILMSYDPSTGARTALSGTDAFLGQSFGVGPEMARPESVIADPGAPGSLIVLDQGATNLFRVNRSSGDRVLVGDNDLNDTLIRSFTIADIGESDRVAVANFSGMEISTVSLSDGTLSPLSRDGLGSGPVFEPFNLVYDPDNTRLLATNLDPQVYSVDIETGERTELFEREGAEFNAISLTNDGAGVFVGDGDSSGARIFRYTLADGESELIATYSGTPFTDPSHFQLDVYDRLWIVDRSIPAVVVVDVSTGDVAFAAR